MSAALLCISPDAEARQAQNDAKALHDRGLEAFKAGRFIEAGEAFLSAHQHDPSASLLWNAARSFEKAADLARARSAYTRYIEHADAKTDKIGRAEDWLKQHAEQGTPTQAKHEVRTPEGTTLVHHVRETHPHPYTHSGWTLVSLGAAGLVGASVAMILAQSSRDETGTLRWGADYEMTLERHRSLTKTTETRELAAWMTYGAALGLLSSGLVLLLSERPTPKTSHAGLTEINISGDGCSVYANTTWRF